METLANNPSQWRLSTLASLEVEQVHELACWAVGTLTSFRLILGRCLLTLHQNKGYKKFGCSSAAHYGSSVLGVNVRFARECKRVADQLQDLPLLSLAAERGEISWGKLREITRVAVPETEEFWLALAPEYSCTDIQALVSKTPYGKVPGEVDLENALTTEFRFSASPQVIELFKRAQRMFSLEREEALSGAEALECLLASFFSSQPLDPEILEEVRREADKDLQAERARRIPEVMAARELARNMGLLSYSPVESEEGAARDERTTSGDFEQDAINEERSTSSDSTQEGYRGSEIGECPTVEQLLCEAVGTPAFVEDSIGCNESCCSRPRGVATGTIKTGGDIFPESPTVGEPDPFTHLAETLTEWQNGRLRFNPTSRHTTPGQTKEILRRDGWKCMAPGCPRAVWLQIHHIEPYSEGGATTRANLICVCESCHRNIHDGLLKITPTSTGKLVFTDQDGRRLERRSR